MNELDWSNEGRDSEECRASTQDLVIGWAGGLLLVVMFVVVTYIALQSAHGISGRTIEATSSFLGVVGTLLLATRCRWAGYGFIAFLGSNAGWLVFSHEHGFQWMFWQQVAFAFSSVVGVWFWLVKGRP